MRSARTLAALGLSLVLVGAGCSNSAKPSEENKDQAQGTEPTTEVSAPQEAAAAVAAAVDSTWQSYSNKALGFEIKFPTKGANAPRWKVGALKESDPSLKDGCVGDSATAEHVNVGDRAFCHTSSKAEVAGKVTETDMYATKVGTLYGVLTFTKEGKTDFDWDAYRKSLDGIIGTYTGK